jgi:hypothetical protein
MLVRTLSAIYPPNNENIRRENPKFVLFVVTSALSPSPALTKFSGTECGERFDLAAI